MAGILLALLGSVFMAAVVFAQPGGGPPPGGDSGMSGGPPSGGMSSGCVNPSCSNPPCAASELGDVGCTTVSGVEILNHELLSKGDVIPVGSHIYGPFEAGFTSMQDDIIREWGCSTPADVYDSEGGHDIGLAESLVASKCGIEFPRIEGDTYYGAVGPCGGHTSDYHFHGRFYCLYEPTGGHSTSVGEIGDHLMYGKWEDYENSLLPYLDACGGHFGPTPESPSEDVYHYHVQDTAPFTIGCNGPSADGGLVSVQTCRDISSGCGDDSDIIELDGVEFPYDRYCSCYDANGNNVGEIEELPALSTSEISYKSTDMSDFEKLLDNADVEVTWDIGTETGGGLLSSVSPSVLAALVVVLILVIGIFFTWRYKNATGGEKCLYTFCGCLVKTTAKTVETTVETTYKGAKGATEIVAGTKKTSKGNDDVTTELLNNENV